MCYPHPIPPDGGEVQGAEARSGFILPSTLAVMGGERPWGRKGFQDSRKDGEMEGAGQSLLL